MDFFRLNKQVLLLAGCSFALSSGAQSSEIRVMRADGQRAIVQFPAGVQPEQGKTYTLSDGSRKASSSAGAGSRKWLLGGNVSFASTGGSITTTIDGEKETVKSDDSLKTLTASPSFGYNFGRFEVGPSLGLNYTSDGEDSATTIALGGFFEGNIFSNEVGTQLVPFVRGDAMFGTQMQSNAEEGAVSPKVYTLIGSGGVKYFLSPESKSALRVQGGFSWVGVSTAVGENGDSVRVNAYGPFVSFGVATYF
jgi:hypothetical protein